MPAFHEYHLFLFLRNMVRGSETTSFPLHSRQVVITKFYCGRWNLIGDSQEQDHLLIYRLKWLLLNI